MGIRTPNTPVGTPLTGIEEFPPLHPAYSVSISAKLGQVSVWGECGAGSGMDNRDAPLVEIFGLLLHFDRNIS